MYFEIKKRIYQIVEKSEKKVFKVKYEDFIAKEQRDNSGQ